MKFVSRITLALLFSTTLAFAQNSAPKLAATPPMGWNSWNHFADKVDDKTVRAAADALVATGMRDAGYVYVNIDDTWEAGRDAEGRIQTNSKFPDMKALADYVHSKGLKLGVYSSPAAKTCAGFTGSQGHEEQDAATYASWGVDYLKYDLCDLAEPVREATKVSPEKAIAIMTEAYTKMHVALQKSGRPIVYSLCQYGWHTGWRWGASVGGNLWRTTGDIEDTFDSMTKIGFSQAGLSRYAGPGHWNDPDMLEVGNGGMSADEYRFHMSLWSMLAAPLLAGNDLEHMSEETQSILMNREVIAIDQDPLGRQADRFSSEMEMEVWTRPLANGDVAIALFNRGAFDSYVSVDLAAAGLPKGAELRDLWKHESLGAQKGVFTRLVKRHTVLLLRAHPLK